MPCKTILTIFLTSANWTEHSVISQSLHLLPRLSFIHKHEISDQGGARSLKKDFTLVRPKTS